MSNIVITSILGMGGLALFFAVILAFANEKLQVKDDPKVTEIENILPNVNCGACGFLSCHEYAVHLANNTADITSCRAGGEEVVEKLSSFLGVKAKPSTKKIAILHCSADNKTRTKKADYNGILTCRAKDLIQGGDVLCEFGCLGEGDCQKVCPFDAIVMENGLPHIIPEKCTACGKCVKACPRNLVSLEEINTKGEIIYVGCSSHDNIQITRKSCSVGCIACKICEKLSKDLFEIKDNLSILNYEKVNQDASVDLTMSKCPTKVIKKVKLK